MSRTKTALGVLQVIFNLFPASFLKLLGIYFSRKAKEKNPSVLVALLSVPRFVYGDVILSSPLFW